MEEITNSKFLELTVEGRGALLTLIMIYQENLNRQAFKNILGVGSFKFSRIINELKDNGFLKIEPNDGEYFNGYEWLIFPNGNGQEGN